MMDDKTKRGLVNAAKSEDELVAFVQELIDETAHAAAWCHLSAHWSCRLDELISSDAVGSRVRAEHARLIAIRKAIRTLIDSAADRMCSEDERRRNQ